jgi:hypothetical protein
MLHCRLDLKTGYDPFLPFITPDSAIRVDTPSHTLSYITLAVMQHCEITEWDKCLAEIWILSALHLLFIVLVVK